MLQTFTPNLKKLLVPLLVQGVLSLVFVLQGFAQGELVFPVETMGTSTSATVAEHETNDRFVNNSKSKIDLFMSGVNSQVNINEASLGYAGASGGSNILLLNNNNGIGFFQISDIDASNYSQLTLSFGVWRVVSGNADASRTKLEYSTDGGTTWSDVEYTNLSTNKTWERRTVSLNMNTDRAANLRIKFTHPTTPTGQYRIDDVELTGTALSSRPEISGFYPMIGGAGTEITVTGKGLNDVTDAYFTEDFSFLEIVSRKDDTLVLEVTGAYFEEFSQIALITSSGEVVSEGAFRYVVPVITSMTPTSGGEGVTVTFKGDFLSTAHTVIFGGGKEVYNLSKSEENGKDVIEVNVPEGARSGQVRILTSIGIAYSPDNFILTPEITSLSTYSEKINQPITINGLRLNEGGNPLITFTGSSPVKPSGVFTQSNGTVSLYVNVPTTAQTGPIKVTTSEGTATSETLNVLRPEIVLTPAGSITFPTTVAGTASGYQQYNVKASNLVNNISVAVPQNFEISANGGASYTSYPNSVTLTMSTVQTEQGRNIFVRYKPSAAGSHSGNLSHSTTGNSEIITLSGTAVEALRITELSTNNGVSGTSVQINGYRLNIGGNPTVVFGGGVVATNMTSVSETAVVVTVPAGAQTGAITLTTTEGTATSGTFTVLQPSIAVSGTLTTFYTEVNKASAQQSYTISGSNLSQGVTVTAPEHFQVSLTTAENGFGRTVLVPQTNASTGSLSSTTIYVRYLPANEGTHSGTSVRNASAGVSDVLVAVQGEAILPQGSLPVELISFNYVQQQDGVLLNWKTASEKDNSHFEIEMANDPKNGFVRVGRMDSKVVNSATLTQYQYKHSFTSTGGTRYYRLKQVDLNGTSEYSNVVAVETKAAQAVETVTVAPNPLNYNSKVFFSALSEGKAVLRLHSLEGKQVYSKEAVIRKGDNEIQLPVYDQLVKGVYILTVELNGTIHKVKVLKQ